ncbi:MAG: hypothetical protein K2Y22_15075 [Candidatus Obscuribacterales bacterium]|nr:hypothetical protein [Candidatus Obscuribacterales bacterium]
MKKDNSKQASAVESAVSEMAKAAEPAQLGHGHVDHVELPEAVEHGGVTGHEILLHEYNESAKLLGLSETTEKTLVMDAERQGKQPDEAISAYLHEQLPKHDFYEQPVLLGS